MSVSGYIIVVDDNVRKIIEQGIHDLEMAERMVEDRDGRQQGLLLNGPLHTVIGRGLTSLTVLKSKIEEIS
jgi:hypothetical protein